MIAVAPIRLMLVLLLLIACGATLTPAAAQVAPGERAYWPTDGWQTTAPESQGMDPAILAEADARIRNELPYLTSTLVVRGGDLVFEEYYGGFSQTDTVQIWSLTKSVTATAVGIAVAEGLLSLDQTIGELIPDRIPATADPRTASVTVEQLLTMTSGFAWDSSGDYSRAFDEVDPTERALGLPMSCDPGTCYEYNSGNVQVLSSIVQAVSGETLADYTQPRLFDPLGIPRPVWSASVAGETLGAVGLNVTPRDLAKIGYLYLNDGVWAGEQIVPSAWVNAATSAQSSGMNAAGVSLGQGATGYGYLWWITEVAGAPAYFGLGLGSQMLYVVPALDLVVVATSSNAIPYEVPIEQQQYPKPIIEELIVRAATGPVATSATEQIATATTAAVSPSAPAASPAVAQPPAQAALPAATAIAGGRLFALPGPRVFPEGITYQAVTGDFYVGSIIDGTIYRGNVERGEVEVLPSDRPGTTAIGLALDGQGRLFVAGGQTGFVAVYDTTTGERLLELGNGLGPHTFLNDIAVTAAGDAYITDSWNPILYRLPATALPAAMATPGIGASLADGGALEVFLNLNTTPFSFVSEGYNANGIVATPDSQFLLIVQSNTGALYRVDLASRDLIHVDLGGNLLTGGDGMAIVGLTLYVVTGETITVVDLAGDFTSGTVAGSYSNPAFSSPTTIAHVNGCLLVVNSQFANLRGQPVLPFTVASVPLPAVAGATPVATATC